MKKRKYADGTTVSVGKSKDEITRLLRDWGADRVAWQEDFTNGSILLGFVWTKDGQQYGARIEVHLMTEKEIREAPENLDMRTNKPSEARVRQALERHGRSEMRLLLLWLKAAFNAVEAGIVKPETLFMPFFVTSSGETVADVVLPNLPTFVAGKFDMKRLNK